MFTNTQASSRYLAPRLGATNCVSIGASIDHHDALSTLQRQLLHGTRRLEQISSVSFQTCEVSTCCFPDCAAVFLACECDVFLMPSTSVSLTRRRWHSTRHVPVPRGLVVRSAWRRLGSFVDAPCRASHGGSTQLPRYRSQVPIWPSAPTGALHSVCVAVSPRSSPHPATMKSSPRTTMSESRNACPDAHVQLLELSKSMSAPTSRTRWCHPAAAGSVPYIHFFSSQHPSVSRRRGGFTYVSVSASACENARLASTTMKCRRLPILDIVACHVTHEC